MAKHSKRKAIPSVEPCHYTLAVCTLSVGHHEHCKNYEWLVYCACCKSHVCVGSLDTHACIHACMHTASLCMHAQACPNDLSIMYDTHKTTCSFFHCSKKQDPSWCGWMPVPAIQVLYVCMCMFHAIKQVAV